MARAQPGFLGFVQLADAATRRLLLLTLWESETAMEEGESAGYYRSQLAKLGAVLRGQPTRDSFTVGLLDVAGAGSLPRWFGRIDPRWRTPASVCSYVASVCPTAATCGSVKTTRGTAE